MLQVVLQGWAMAGSTDSLGATARRRDVPRGRETGLTQAGSGETAPDPGQVPEAPAAFAEAYATHEPDVVRVCRRLLGGREEAKDAPQEVYLRARQSFSHYDPARPFRPWLLAIAGNYCIDQLRRHANGQRVFVDVDPEEAEAPEAAGLSPLGGLLAREERDLLGRAIAKLPVKYRLPLALRYFSELDYDSIAEVLGVSRNQVATLLFRAKQRLRAALDEPGRSPRRRSSHPPQKERS